MNHLGGNMLLNSNTLSQILEDAILCYEMTVGRIHPKRQEQIAQIRRMCDGSNYDAMIETFIIQLCHRIQRERSYMEWLLAKSSRLGIILLGAIEEYRSHKVSIEYSSSVALESEPVVRQVISWDKITERRDQLLGSDVLALTNG